MEVIKARAGALRTPFLGPEGAQTRSRRRVLRARSTAVQAGASQCAREREGEREGESLHGEILNRDPWWLTERGGCLFRQQPHGALGAEATVENPHAKRPVHATKSRLSVRGARAQQWLCANRSQKSPPQKNARLPPGATPTAFPAVDGRIFGYGRPPSYPAAFQRSFSLTAHKEGSKRLLKTAGVCPFRLRL